MCGHRVTGHVFDDVAQQRQFGCARQVSWSAAAAVVVAAAGLGCEGQSQAALGILFETNLACGIVSV